VDRAGAFVLAIFSCGCLSTLAIASATWSNHEGHPRLAPRRRRPDGRAGAPLLRETSGLARIDIVRASIEPLDRKVLDADVVFFGGSGRTACSTTCRGFAVRWISFRRSSRPARPAWASCFGYQGLALALGGEVVHDMDRQRLGVYRIHREPSGDPLFSVLPPTFYAQLGHTTTSTGSRKA
jgi:GMP synthase-like glutamine amidotransferase